MGQIGRLIAVGIGKETTRGTAVAPDFYIPLTDFDFDDKAEVAVQEGRRARIEASYGGDVVKKWAEGNMEGNIYSDSFGLVLLSALGGLSTAANADGSGNVYDHTYSVQNGNTHQSLTLSTEDAEAGDKEYAGVVVTSLEITGEEGSYVKFSAGLMGNSETGSTETSSFSTEYPFRPQDLTFKLASAVSGLSGASAVGIKSFTLSIEKNVEANWNLGSLTPSEFYNKQFSVQLEIELIHTGDTYRDLFIAGTSRAFLLSLVNSDVTIGTAANPQLDITLASGQITDWVRNQGNDDIVTETLTIRCDYSTSESSLISAVLTNLTSSY